MIANVRSKSECGTRDLLLSKVRVCKEFFDDFVGPRDDHELILEMRNGAVGTWHRMGLSESSHSIYVTRAKDALRIEIFNSKNILNNYNGVPAVFVVDDNGEIEGFQEYLRGLPNGWRVYRHGHGFYVAERCEGDKYHSGRGPATMTMTTQGEIIGAAFYWCGVGLPRLPETRESMGEYLIMAREFIGGPIPESLWKLIRYKLRESTDQFENLQENFQAYDSLAS